MIYVNIILEIVLYPIGIVNLIMLLMLTQSVYLRIVLTNTGVIKHVSLIIKADLTRTGSQSQLLIVHSFCNVLVAV